MLCSFVNIIHKNMLHFYIRENNFKKISFSKRDNKKKKKKIYPDTVLITLMVIFNVVILIINEILKKVEERIKINRQKYLKVLFGTRLGMWSPK
ncbi:hypothetical protein PFTANZ_02945 [Plasmodium falciparum Tanzania (2000708)]|uniref:Uncharacterized protein n=1 Tax=Plasmodium falciparum Tanzania (2000708) TaxID=1036725 RepID=A0A024W775_PLAFA|nr:hypothetical protein PFTANZ_02945 [Plasmodium falciparum Tanzania (2000708)]